MSNWKVRMVGGAGALLLLSLTLLDARTAQAEPIEWTFWSTPRYGTIDVTCGISVAYTGQTIGLATNYPSWSPASSFSGGTVSNAPPQAFNAVKLSGGTTSRNTVTFSTPVVNPVIAIWSLGSPSLQASFNFDPNEQVTLQAGGPSAEYGGSGLDVSGNSVFGAEGNGTIQFSGVYKQLTWTNPTFENYYVFTVGIAGRRHCLIH